MSGNLISNAANGPTIDRSTFTATRMIVYRVVILILPLVEVVLLATTLGFNNSSSSSELPESAVSCGNNSEELYLYTSSFLTRSINIFCGLWLGFCCLAVIYQTIVLLITFMRSANINYPKLLRVDIGLNSFFMWIFIDGAAGSFIMGFLWSAYNSVIDVDGGPRSVAVATVVLQYFAFVMFIPCMSFYYTVVMYTSIYASKCCSDKSCGGSQGCGTRSLKDMPKDSDPAY